MLQKEVFNYPVALRALKKWSETNLELISRSGKTLHFNFLYIGSTCNNGGTEFKAHLHTIIENYDSYQIIQNAWIEIPEDEKGNASAMCAVPSDSQEKADLFFENLRKSPSFVKKDLAESILEECALNYAGCFCSPAMINQKWKMVLSTVHYYVNNL